MSGAALGWAKAQRAPTATAKAVLVCLADYADEHGVAWPAVPRLAREVQASDRTVQRALRSLEECGLLETQQRDRQDGGQTSNGYRLVMTPGDKMTPAPVTECHPPGDASVTPPVTPVSPPYEPPLEPPLEQEPRKPARAAYPEAFEAAWRAYPHIQGRSRKPQALAAWKAMTGDDRDGLPKAIEAFSRDVDRVCGGKGAPDMSRWLRDGRHESYQPQPDRLDTENPPDARVLAGRQAHYAKTGHWSPDWGPLPAQPQDRAA